MKEEYLMILMILNYVLLEPIKVILKIKVLLFAKNVWILEHVKEVIYLIILNKVN